MLSLSLLFGTPNGAPLINSLAFPTSHSRLPRATPPKFPESVTALGVLEGPVPCLNRG